MECKFSSSRWPDLVSGPQGSRFDSCRAHHFLNTRRPPSRLLKVATVATNVATRIWLDSDRSQSSDSGLGASRPHSPAALAVSDQNGLMRDGLGVFLVAVGLSLTVLLQDKLGLVIAFAEAHYVGGNAKRKSIYLSKINRSVPVIIVSAATLERKVDRVTAHRTWLDQRSARCRCRFRCALTQRVSKKCRKLILKAVRMASTHRLAQSQSLPVKALRGEPMISTSAGVNAPLVAAIVRWLTEGTGEPPNILREEPPDQMAAALAQSGNAFALMTEHRAIYAATRGLVYRRLTPAPVIEYGVAHPLENRSAALASLLRTVHEIVPPLPVDLPAGSELLGAGRVATATSKNGGANGAVSGQFVQQLRE
jgi:hypothetical protein